MNGECDSVIINCNNYIPSDTITIDTSFCFTPLPQIPDLVLTNQAGCDSVIQFNSILIEADTFVNDIFICGIGTNACDTLLATGMNGECDSVIINCNNYIPSDTITIDTAFCFTPLPQIPDLVLTNQAGCDSVIQFNSILIEADTFVNDIFICCLLYTSDAADE